MTKDDLLKRKIATKEVTAGDVTVKIRKLTASQMQVIQTKYRTDDAGIIGYAYAIAAAVVNDKDERVFTDKDVDAVANTFDYDIAKAIGDEIMAFTVGRTKPEDAADPKAESPA